jgi:hypothetical protein
MGPGSAYELGVISGAYFHHDMISRMAGAVGVIARTSFTLVTKVPACQHSFCV